MRKLRKTKKIELKYKGFEKADENEGNPDKFWDFVFNGVLQMRTKKFRLTNGSRKDNDVYNSINALPANLQGGTL